MRSLRIRALSLTVLAILLLPLSNLRSSISMADHLLTTGTIVPLRMNTSLSSETSQVGQTWSATVFQDVLVNNELVIPRGSVVEGHLLSVDDADRFGRSGRIAIDFDRIVFPNGSRLENINAMLTSLDPRMRAQIDSESRISGKDRSFKQNVYFIGGGAGAGALIGAIAGGGEGAGIGAGAGAVAGLILSAFNKGREVNIPAGTEFGMELISQSSVPVNYYGSGQTTIYRTVTERSVSNADIVDLSRSDIIELQKQLRQRGFYRGAINGVFTSATRQALLDFQEDNRLTVSGRVDSRTAGLLGLNIYDVSNSTTITTTNTIQLNRNDIVELQQELRSRGFYRGSINGFFNATTRQALMNFQEENNLPVTGTVNTHTAQLLRLSLLDTAGTGSGSGLEDIDPNGQPSFMGVGSTHRYIIWREGNLWNIRTTTAGQMHDFDGRIVANGGTIRSINRTGSLEQVDQLGLDRSRKVLNFDFSTAGGMDGFSFYSDADSLTFDLNMDGRRTARNVFVGHQGTNPVSVPFTLQNE
jgi:peptidoglycan hydrolase-like protein with peptidoglycan-binding domain